MEIIFQTSAGNDLMSDLLTGPKGGVVLLSGLNAIQIIRIAIIAETALPRFW